MLLGKGLLNYSPFIFFRFRDALPPAEITPPVMNEDFLNLNDIQPPVARSVGITPIAHIESPRIAPAQQDQVDQSLGVAPLPQTPEPRKRKVCRQFLLLIFNYANLTICYTFDHTNPCYTK